jgi:hypothetical protein
MRDTIDMAREAGESIDKNWLERFAELVRADQCEIDAKIADDLTKHSFLGSVGDAIRARSNT